MKTKIVFLICFVCMLLIFTTIVANVESCILIENNHKDTKYTYPYKSYFNVEFEAFGEGVMIIYISAL